MSKFQTGLEIYNKKGIKPLLQKTIDKIFFDNLSHNAEFNLRTKINRIYNKRKYSHTANLYKTLNIETDVCSHRCTNISLDCGLGYIQAGNWDRYEMCTPINEFWRIKGIKQRFQNQLQWSDTVYYETVKSRIDERGCYWGYESIDDFQHRFDYIDDLYADMYRNGYKINGDSKLNFPSKDFRNNTYKKCSNLEILVFIGRDGRFLLRDGHHRFAIADVLGIDIFAQVLARHKKWQKIRDLFGNSDSIEDIPPEFRYYSDHPDLQDVKPSA